MFLPADIDEEILSRETPAEVLRGHGEVILVVDDEQSILRVTKMILEDKGYRVLAAHDGREAIGIFTQEMNAIRAVLTDMSLPFMDGIALIRHLKEMNPTMPFIASTGQSEHAHARELEKLGVQGLLTKPYDTQKLLEALHEALAPKN